VCAFALVGLALGCTKLNPNQLLRLKIMHIFAYGSLMYPEIFVAVTGVTLRHTSAALSGWQRFALADRTYPGAMPSHEGGASILGVLWFDLPKEAILALDRFEGDEYKRVCVTVTTEEGQRLPAEAYQWGSPELTRGPWNIGAFEREHRAEFFRLHQP
jgi:gamma-glutamylcyclotransferase (GGCT)/AIG2-like uncharacterized protein YtfP